MGAGVLAAAFDGDFGASAGFAAALAAPFATGVLRSAADLAGGLFTGVSSPQNHPRVVPHGGTKTVPALPRAVSEARGL